MMKQEEFSVLLKVLKLDWFADNFYRQPRSLVNFYRSKGVFNVYSAQMGEFSLKQRIKSITPPNYPTIDLKIVFLTGEKYWHQTALCALSLIHAIKRMPSFTIYDDGTLTTQRIQLLTRILPTLVVISKEQAEKEIDKVLSKDRYPCLREAREKFILMKKIIDVNLISPDTIYLDSDMIFWKYPFELLELYKKGNPFFMVEPNVPENLGFICDSLKILESVGIEPIQHFNSGIFHLGNSKVDWDWIESWCLGLMSIQNQHNPNMLEQTLCALLFKKIKDAVSLPNSYYVAYHQLPESSVLTHYIYLMKFKYMNTEQYRWFRQAR